MAEQTFPIPGSTLLQVDRKRIYIAADDHTDYLWTADEETYRKAFLEMLDYYLDLAEETQDEPTEFQSRWNCDGSFWMWTYEKNKSTPTFERLIEHIRSGHISVPLNALAVCFGGIPAEAVLRGMYYPGQIERRYNIRFPLVYSMENQTLPYGLVSLWVGAGASYSWKGICGCASRTHDAGDREHEIYWWEGPDGSQLLMKWNSLYGEGIGQGIGGYAEARNPRAAVDFVSSDPEFRRRYPYEVIGAFGKGWDDLKTLTDEFVEVAKSMTNAQRQVIVSNETDFFEDFSATYSDDLPTVSASFGNEWDLYCASMAEVSALVKRSVEKLRSAEALSTLVGLVLPNALPQNTTFRDQTWMNLGLYWEHDWTADGDVPRSERARWQRRLATEIADYVDTLYGEASSALGRSIEKSAETSFYVFNPLSWARTDVADIPYTGPQPVHVFDVAAGEEMPSQFVTRDGSTFLRILARNVPAIGYKVYEIRSGAGADLSDAATVQGGILENDFYRLEVSPSGAIVSLVDKTQGSRVFVDRASDQKANHLGEGEGVLRVENAGPVSVTLHVVVNDTSPARESRITLFREVNRIDIRNTLTDNFDEVLTWDFEFNLDQPDVYHEEVGAIIRARLLEDGGHYASQSARYDWLTLNHFADMSGSDGSGITLSNADCYFMRLGHSEPDKLDVNTPTMSVLAGGQVDGQDLGIRSQDGDRFFLQRFALCSHAGFEQVSAMKFALAHQNPLVAGMIDGGDALPGSSYSLLTISDPGVLLWALKPAEEGINQGVIARMWNLNPAGAQARLTFNHFSVADAVQTTHIETPLHVMNVVDHDIETHFTTQQMKTFLLAVEG